MEKIAIDKALAEVRQAQRVLVAFYQRVKDIILLMRTELGVEHCYWGTMQFSMPGTSANDLVHPQRWSWDALPMADVVFSHTKDGNWSSKQSVAQMVEIRLITDDVFIVHGKGYDPSPMSMPQVTQSATYLEITVYQVQRTEGDDWGNDWSVTKNRIKSVPNLTLGLHRNDDWQVYRQRFDFSQLRDKACVVEQMITFKQLLTDHGFEGFSNVADEIS
ncbi:MULTISPECIES: hypothetical protein [Shewanella]|uniref:hypothetical protein n=1 Tax=Shewanella TaxID=22 RepID=UPI00200C1CE6|nr:hypothetical protein [Shewanella profunda]MCL1090944.1 hypothetical protein [Shewanella profunda]